MKANLLGMSLLGFFLFILSAARGLEAAGASSSSNQQKTDLSHLSIEDNLYSSRIRQIVYSDIVKIPADVKNKLNSQPSFNPGKVPGGTSVDRIDTRWTQRRISQCMSDYLALVEAGILGPEDLKRLGNVAEQIGRIQIDPRSGRTSGPENIVGGCEAWARIRENMYTGLPNPSLSWSKKITPSKVTWSYQVKDFPRQVSRTKIYGNYRRGDALVKEQWKFKEFQARILPGCIKDKVYPFSAQWSWFSVPKKGSISINTNELRTSFLHISGDLGSDIYKQSVPICLQVRAVSNKPNQIKPMSGDYRFAAKYSDLASEVRPFTIIGFGDSYGSGEGNPSRARSRGLLWWNDSAFSTLLPSSSDSTMIGWTSFCHRSSKSGLGKAVLGLKDMHPDSEINFGHFACSGASTGHLSNSFRGPYTPAAQSSRRAPGQLVQANNWLERNNISKSNVDVVVASFGGNDAGFSKVIVRCVLLAGICTPSQSTASKVGDLLSGDTISGMRQEVRDLKASARSSVSNALWAAGWAIANNYPNARVYFTTYPNSMIRDHSASTDRRKYCSKVHRNSYNSVYNTWSDDPNWDLEISEARFLSQFANNVNDGVRDAVSRLTGAGKNVGLIDVASDPRAEDRGWCVPANTTRSAGSLLRLNDQAVAMQGADMVGMLGEYGVRSNGVYSSGGWHPNDTGYSIYSYVMKDVLRGNEKLRSSTVQHASDSIASSYSTPRVTRHNR